MKNSLTPQLRPDRNGKMVTRHVKSGTSTSPSLGKVPAPSLSPSVLRQYMVPERDVERPRRAPTTKQAAAEAKQIRDFFGVSSTEEANGSVKMSDNEILDYMQEGFSANAAIEFKRWGISPATACMSTIPRLRVKETVKRMRALDLTPDEASRIIRNGMTDNLLDKYLTDNELFGVLDKEKLHSPKYADRSKGVVALVTGANTRDDYRELGFENLGKYGGYLRVKREAGEHIDYRVFRKAIERVEGAQHAIPQERYHEGWTQYDSKMGMHSLLSLVKSHGPEVLDIRHLGVFRLGTRFGYTMEGYRFLDEFFTLAGNTPLVINQEQRKEMESWEERGWKAADLTEGMRRAGLTPEQTLQSITAGLTLEKAKEVHLNRQSAAMIEGWL